jgi:MerR family transcriptional regulator/heat shock protein HspR
MKSVRYEIVFPAHEKRRLKVEALAECAGVHPILAQRFIECGLIEPSGREGAEWFFDEDAVPRLQMICRLRDHLGINVAGIAVILDLRDRLTALQRENAVFRARL